MSSISDKRNSASAKGRIAVIMRLVSGVKPSISLGSGRTRIADVNVDVSRNARPDVVADLRWLPFVSQTFREVIISDVIEHIPSHNEQRALKEAYRVLL